MICLCRFHAASGYGVKLVAAVAISAAGLGSAHLMHVARSPVPALITIWPLPRQCLHVFEVFMWCDWLEWDVVAFWLFPMRRRIRCRHFARCRRLLHWRSLRLRWEVKRLGIAENGRLNALPALVFCGWFRDSVRVAVLILAVAVFAHLKIEIKLAVGVSLDARSVEVDHKAILASFAGESLRALDG